MRAQITLKAVTSSTCTVRSKRRELAFTSRCDHCREEFRLGAHCYWHMQFCSAACMSAYQQRLASETKVKISGLREELTEEERYRVANDVVHRLKQHCDPWQLSEDLPPLGKGHST